VRREDRNHAVVMGASIGGLLAARVLADHFERVTLVEQDKFPSGAEHRRGVPQSKHTHGLLASGRQVLEQLFPKLTEELVKSGAVHSDVVRDGRWIQEGACLKRFRSGLDGLLLSRPFLEEMIRRRVLALPNVQALERAAVAGLITNGNPPRITGVRCIRDGKLEIVGGDLIVDAMGRGSRSCDWLEAMNYPKPAIDRVEVALGYTTRFFRRLPSHLNGDLIVVIPPTPEGKRGGVMVAQEGDRWTVTLIAHFGNYPPDDLEGFRNFAKNLYAPDIYEVICDAEPIGDASSTRFPASVRRRYERLRRFPKGYLTFGDSICSFNPIYGQGMSVAALEAIALEETLAKGSGDIAKSFFRRAAKVIDIPWSIAVGNDLRIPEAVGPRTLQVRLINWYISRLHRAAHNDPVPSLAFHKVSNLLAAPPSVMHPKVALRVLKGNLHLSNGRCRQEDTLPTFS
jgi:2-polyprenyl-6-methoxyphenol hydroxylase-like FAD-dependent oxidoreductase